MAEGVLRGGSWNNNPQNVRASNRNRNEPENHNNNLGFRCLGIRALSKEGKARAVWIMVQAGVPGPLPGFGPGEPAEAERRI